MIHIRNRLSVMVSASGTFREMVSVLSRVPQIAVDVEGSSRHHYPDQVSLIQIATNEAIYIVDPLADIDIKPLGLVFEDSSIGKVLHGSDYDLRSLHRDWGFQFRSIYDTHVAGRLGGYENVGLSALIEEILGIKIPKDPKIQKADWKKRPLADNALEYAAQDVAYLFELASALDTVLSRLGRNGWAEEECLRLENVRYTPPDQENIVFSIKGSSKLDGRSLGVLKELVKWRESEARRRDLPVAFVLSDAVIVAIAANPEGKLGDIPALNGNVRRTIGKHISRCIEEGLKSGPIKRPDVPRLPSQTPAQIARLKALKAWRKSEGDILKIDPALIWSARSLERLARFPSTMSAEMNASEVRAWQIDNFGKSLVKFLRALE